MASEKTDKRKAEMIPVRDIEGSIVTIRGRKVMFDADLAELFGTQTRVLVQAVKRTSTGSPRTSCFSSTRRSLIS